MEREHETCLPFGGTLATSSGGIVGDPQKWLIFSLVKPEFLRKVRLCCVFSSSATEALLVTEEDEVWAMGSNAAGCLGIGDTRSCLSPTKVEGLSKKGVQSFACGTGPHVLALTARGEVYGWGHNGYSQVGNDQNSQVSPPSGREGLRDFLELNLITHLLYRQANSPVLVFDRQPVAQIACGGYHSVIRTVSGGVYTWGQNNCGQLGLSASVNHQSPRKVGGAIAEMKCTGISCGHNFTTAVFDTGEVYVWGSNGNGQLGLGSLTNQPFPVKIEQLKDVFIKKVACGFSHTLALTDEGLVYVWGANALGQLGTENKTNQSIPVLMKTIHGRINEVAATQYNQTSAAMTETSKVLMWGLCRGQHVTVPTETPFDSVHDVFVAFSSVPVTPVPMIVRSVWENKLALAMAEHFDNPAHSDLKFLVEGKKIHVHKTVLKFQCEYFRNMFQGPWIENDSDTIEVTQFSYPVYRAFLQYLYTGDVDLAPTEAIGLLDLANSCCETNLRARCQRLLKNGYRLTTARVSTWPPCGIRPKIWKTFASGSP
ncbi:RCC1 and BTB domain-containing protein 1 [Galendromus occidentalis]|uniref:RCC1 and BTB domain-containing protein 1 n=1 Tax=Galendromus occidentalis TaxID=34638 RepID=A0AAJ7SGC1_9ACAR|nr:RCC1 and BTB domain-containing protein 1 [Galendromus occidentalis]